MPRGAQLRGEERRESLTVRLDHSIISQIETRMDNSGLSKTSVVENLLINGLGSQIPNSPVNGRVEQNDDSNPDSDEPDYDSLTEGQQQMFDSAMEIEREQGIAEGRAVLLGEIAEGNNLQRSREENHVHSFKPWLPKCNGGDNCVLPNPDFIEDSTSESELSCETPGCGEQLGKAKDLMNIEGGKCPACGESLFSKIKGVFQRKGSDSDSDSKEDESE